MGSSYRQHLIPLAACGLLLLAAPQGSQAVLVYSADGASISGTLGGVAFANASWSLTATADEGLSSFSTFTVPNAGTFQLWSLPVAPRLKIQTLASVLEADLLPSANLRWLALSGAFPVGPTPKIGFVYTTPWFNPETAAGVFGVPGSFVDLRSPVSFTGASIFEANTFATTAGSLVISSSSTVPGTFRIDPVPAPLPALAVAGVLSWSRRLRRYRASGPAATPPG